MTENSKDDTQKTKGMCQRAIVSISMNGRDKERLRALAEMHEMTSSAFLVSLIREKYKEEISDIKENVADRDIKQT